MERAPEKTPAHHATISCGIRRQFSTKSRLCLGSRQFLETLFQGLSQSIDRRGWIAPEKGIGVQQNVTISGIHYPDLYLQISGNSANEQGKGSFAARQFLSFATNEDYRVRTLLQVQVQHLIAHCEATFFNVATLFHDLG